MRLMKLFCITYVFTLLFSIIGVLNVNATEDENIVVTQLVDKLEDITELKEREPEKYSFYDEVDVRLKLMLQYMGDVKKEAAEQQLDQVTFLVSQDAEALVKIKDAVDELNANFKVWKATPTTAVYEGVQKDVNNLLVTLKSDKEEIAGTETLKIIVIIVFIALALALIIKGVIMKK